MRRDDNRTLEVLGQARPDTLDPAVDDDRRARDLARAMAGPQPSGARRARRTSVLRRAGLVTAVGAFTAAMVVAGVTVVDRQAGGPGDGTAVGPTGDGTATTRLSARSVLLAAAEQSAEAPARTGRYWQLREYNVDYYRVGPPGDRYTIDVVELTAESVPRAENGTRVGLDHLRGARPRGADDVAAWKRDGSPRSWQVRVGYGTTGIVEIGELRWDGRVPTVTREPRREHIYALGAKNVTFADLAALPADPDELRRVLLSEYYEGGGGDLPTDKKQWLFEQGANLVTMLPVRPAVASAAYEMLADLPGVRVTEGVEDAKGRSGVAVGMELHTMGDQVERRIIVAADDHRALGTDLVLRSPGAGDNAVRVGEVISATAVDVGWTDTRLDVPDGAKVCEPTGCS